MHTNAKERHQEQRDRVPHLKPEIYLRLLPATLPLINPIGTWKTSQEERGAEIPQSPGLLARLDAHVEQIARMIGIVEQMGVVFEELRGDGNNALQKLIKALGLGN